jgi:membrane associated rhomboid family serine protease
MLPLGDVEKTGIVPVGTYALMFLNLAMFVLQMTSGEEFTTSWAATPYEISHNVDLKQPVSLDLPASAVNRIVLDPSSGSEAVIPQGPVPFPVWFTLITAMFMHGGIMHLGGNMLYLWIFGDNVEEVLGTVRYVLLYIACGLAASLAQIVAAPNSLIPTLGASGAIAGLMGMYVVWFPMNRIRMLIPFPLFTVVLIPALWFIGFWIVMQFFSGFGSLGHLGQSGGVAYLAHAGGAVAGIGLAFLFRDEAQRRGRELGFDEGDVPIVFRGRRYH